MLFRYRKELKEIASKYTIKLYSRNGEEDLYIKVSDNCTFVVCMCDNRMDLTIEICNIITMTAINSLIMKSAELQICSVLRTIIM